MVIFICFYSEKTFDVSGTSCQLICVHLDKTFDVSGIKKTLRCILNNDVISLEELKNFPLKKEIFEVSYLENWNRLMRRID